MGADADESGVGTDGTVAYLSVGEHVHRGVPTMSANESEGSGRRCPRCGAELAQKASENGVFVCTDCGGSQLR